MRLIITDRTKIIYSMYREGEVSVHRVCCERTTQPYSLGGEGTIYSGYWPADVTTSSPRTWIGSCSNSSNSSNTAAAASSNSSITAIAASSNSRITDKTYCLPACLPAFLPACLFGLLAEGRGSTLPCLQELGLFFFFLLYNLKFRHGRARPVERTCPL